MRSSSRLAAVAVGALISLVFASGALADSSTVQCTSTLPPGTYGNVNVPPNATCEIASANILGNVTVQSNANLYLDYSTTSEIHGSLLSNSAEEMYDEGGWTIDGPAADSDSQYWVVLGGTTHDIGLSGTANVYLDYTTVDGNVASDKAQSGDIYQDTVHGNFVVSRTQFSPEGYDFSLLGPPNQIDGSLYFLDNHGATDAEGTTIGGNLVCLGNNPPPVTYGDQVGGREVGQCAGATDASQR